MTEIRRCYREQTESPWRASPFQSHPSGGLNRSIGREQDDFGTMEVSQ